MIINIILILGILFVSLQFENSKLKIASPLTIIFLSFLIKYIYPDFMGFITREVFSEEMLIFIVLLILSDSFLIKLKEVKENWVSLLYLAGIGVCFSVLFGAYIAKELLVNYDLSYGALIALLAMCMATDPVSVVSVFKQFKIPHKLKFLAEGESLFNDAAALIMFNSFGVAMMLGTIITFDYSITIVSKVIFVAILIGLLIGFIGTILIKWINDLKSELLLILFIAYTSFQVAESIHVSGLLAEIISILTITTIINKSFKLEERRIKKNKEILIENISNTTIRNKLKTKKYIEKFMSDITDVKRHKDIEDILEILALIVNGILFVSLAYIINVELLYKYRYEIIMIFVLTTFIRMVMLGKFMIMSKFIKKIPNISFNWYVVLNLSGIKGGLSIVMLHMMSLMVPNFKYLELFNAIVSGVIILSIFIYVPLLTVFITLNKDKFEKETDLENH